MSIETQYERPPQMGQMSGNVGMRTPIAPFGYDPVGATNANAFASNARMRSMYGSLAGTAADFADPRYVARGPFVANTAADLMQPRAAPRMSRRAMTAMTAADFPDAGSRYVPNRELPFTESQYMPMPSTSVNMGRYRGPVGMGQLASSSAQAYASAGDLADMFSRTAITSAHARDMNDEGGVTERCACCGEEFDPNEYSSDEGEY